jgi:hypothetical protein
MTIPCASAAAVCWHSVQHARLCVITIAGLRINIAARRDCRAVCVLEATSDRARRRAAVKEAEEAEEVEITLAGGAIWTLPEAEKLWVADSRHLGVTVIILHLNGHTTNDDDGQPSCCRAKSWQF